MPGIIGFAEIIRLKEGKRDIIGVDVCNKENETNWSMFFNGLKNRGLKGVRLVISDAHPGLVKAIEENFPGCQWQKVPGPL